ncbi:MAG: hypothetical protein IPK59_23170 [Rhodospirillaceae bacterium]|nr:hypothetical protein [Rhodospirillaceae bacterium]
MKEATKANSAEAISAGLMTGRTTLKKIVTGPRKAGGGFGDRMVDTDERSGHEADGPGRATSRCAAKARQGAGNLHLRCDLKFNVEDIHRRAAHDPRHHHRRK